MKRTRALRGKERPRGLFRTVLSLAWLSINVVLDLLDLLFGTV